MRIEAWGLLAAVREGYNLRRGERGLDAEVMLMRCAGFVLIVLGCAAVVDAQATAGRRSPLAEAIKGQELVAGSLERILLENKVMMDEQALREAIDGLLKDESRQEEGIVTLGKQTFSKQADELTEADKKARDLLNANQDIYTDRYGRLEKIMEVRTAARPESAAAELLVIAEETQLSQRMGEAGEMLRVNQLGRALSTTKDIVAALQRMVDAANKATGKAEKESSSGEVGFVAPSLWVRGDAQILPEFPWGGDAVESMAQILRSLKKLDELVQRQQAVADQTKALAPKEKTAEKLAKEENDINAIAMDVATRLAILDPQLDRLLRTAVATIDEAIPGMSQGPLSQSVEPSARAVAQLKAAADRLRATWKDILERIKKYTQDTEPMVGGASGIPHGMSAALKEMLSRNALMMLRATGALTQAILRETALTDQTKKAEPAGDWSAMKSEQEAVAKFVGEEVVPFNVSMKELPPYMRAAKAPPIATPAAELLADAMERMGQAATGLGAKDKAESVKREQESIELMNDAMVVMVNILQRLLGQLSPPGMSKMGGPSAGLALSPGSGAGGPASWQSQLLPQQRDAVRQAFRGSFPQRYDRAIKLYYQAIAKEKP